MLKKMRFDKALSAVLVLAYVTLHSVKVFAGCESILSRSVGWTILGSKTIEGWRDAGKRKEDGFEGCDFDRVIYFIDGTRATCMSYGYQYAFMPTAIILGRSVTVQGKTVTILKMVVEGDEYDLR